MRRNKGDVPVQGCRGRAGPQRTLVPAGRHFEDAHQSRLTVTVGEVGRITGPPPPAARGERRGLDADAGTSHNAGRALSAQGGN